MRGYERTIPLSLAEIMLMVHCLPHDIDLRADVDEETCNQPITYEFHCIMRNAPPRLIHYFEDDFSWNA